MERITSLNQSATARRAMFCWRGSGLVVVLLGLLGAGPAPVTQPSTQQSTQPMAADNSQPGNRRDRNKRDRGNRFPAISASDPYAALRTRSIFVRGDQTIASDKSGARTGAGRNSLVDQPEAALVFNGVIMVGDEANAMIETRGANNVQLVRAGDPISVGKISTITFSELVYEGKGTLRHVLLGQNLLGEFPSAEAPNPTAAPAGGPGVADGNGAASPGAAPPAGAPGATPGGSSAEEILARMRAKRNAELGIK